MDRWHSPIKRVGILGGGQLGRMLILAGRPLDMHFTIVDPEPECPAHSVADQHIIASYREEHPIRQVAKHVDVLTWEIEHVHVSTLQEVNAQVPVYPDPTFLAQIQDKLRQREMLRRAGFPVPAFREVTKPHDLHSLGFPVVQKLRFGGYDGRGVRILRTPKDIAQAFTAPSYIEQFIHCQKELAILVARNPQGEVRTYPVAEMVFHPQAHLLDYLIVPARIPEKTARFITEMAKDLVNHFRYVGVLAIELFWDVKDRIYINELAPRVHNAGHYTLDACQTSQFEQHLRAICDFPLGDTTLLAPAILFNLVGEPHTSAGQTMYEGLRSVLAVPGVHLHLYGKRIVRPYRKMGHITIVHRDIKMLFQLFRAVRNRLKIYAEEKTSSHPQNKANPESAKSPAHA